MKLKQPRKSGVGAAFVWQSAKAPVQKAKAASRTHAAPSLAGSRAVVHAVIDGGLTGMMVLSEIES